MIKQTVIALGLMAAAGTGTVFAAQSQVDGGTTASAGPDQGFATLDADDNGRISWSEAKNNIPRSVFESADSNGDGVLSKSEYQTSGQAGAGTDTGMGSMSGDSMSGDSMDSMSGDTSGAGESTY